MNTEINPTLTLEVQSNSQTQCQVKQTENSVPTRPSSATLLLASSPTAQENETRSIPVFKQVEHRGEHARLPRLHLNSENSDEITLKANDKHTGLMRRAANVRTPNLVHNQRRFLHSTSHSRNISDYDYRRRTDSISSDESSTSTYSMGHTPTFSRNLSLSQVYHPKSSLDLVPRGPDSPRPKQNFGTVRRTTIYSSPGKPERQLIVEQVSMADVAGGPGNSLFKWNMAPSSGQVIEDDQEQFMYTSDTLQPIRRSLSTHFCYSPSILGQSNCDTESTSNMDKRGLRMKRSSELRSLNPSHTIPQRKLSRTMIPSIASSDTAVGSDRSRPNSMKSLKRDSRNYTIHDEFTFPGLQSYKQQTARTLLLSTPHVSYHAVDISPQCQSYTEFEWRPRGRKRTSVCGWIVATFIILLLSACLVGFQGLQDVKVRVKHVNGDMVDILVAARNWNFVGVPVDEVNLVVKIGEWVGAVDNWESVPVVEPWTGQWNATGVLGLTGFNDAGIIIYPYLMEVKGSMKYTPPLARLLRVPERALVRIGYQIPVCLEAFVESASVIKSRACFTEEMFK